jgi:hypothetical protein
VRQFVATALIALAAQSGAASASAQTMVPEAAPSVEDRAERTLTLTLAASKVGEDWFALVAPGMRLVIPDLTISNNVEVFGEEQTWDLKFDFQVPLRFRMIDNNPQNEQVFRTEDWDSPAEYMRFVRSVEYGIPYGGVYLRGGELIDVRLGHRTIVDSYNNTVSVDHFQWGLQAATNTVYGGAELLVDNVAGPQLVGTRLYARPLAFVQESGFGRRFATGASIVGDWRAPAELTTNVDGTYARDDEGNFIVERDRAAAIAGLDVELTAVSTEKVTVTPYSDANFHLSRGAGWHTGVFAGFEPTEQLVIDTRAELRWLGANYMPSYFGPLYEVERFVFRAPESTPTALTKLQWLRTDQEDERRFGWLLEAGFNLGRYLHVAASWEDEKGPDNSTAWLRVSVPAISRVKFGAWWINSHFEGIGGFFDIETAMAVAEAQVMLTDWLFVTGQANRRWQLDGDGNYRPVDDFAVGAGAAIGF